MKATGFGRVDFDVRTTLRQIHGVNPHALMFGTDLPGTRARRPFEAQDIEILADAVGFDLDDVLSNNARSFYRLTT